VTMSRTPAPQKTPRLTVGLPVHNGEAHLAAAVDALLAQTFTDFELIVSDNASTDGTRAIAEGYAARDPRVRYLRHDRNRGAAFNHNVVIDQARGELFKWASDDDLYAPDLLARCVAALDARPEVVLAHAWTAFIDEGSAVVERRDYPLDTDTPDVARRFRSLLHTQGGDDIYGVIRLDVLNRIPRYGSYHLPDRVFVAELALHGAFHNEPDFLYFRRDHPGRLERQGSDSVRHRAAIADPRRANRRRHPLVRLYGEYVYNYVRAVLQAPLGLRDRLRCLGVLAVWLLGHADPRSRARLVDSPDPAVRQIGQHSRVTRASRWVAEHRPGRHHEQDHERADARTGGR
jgi:glycosyltransferase involved in cell wall biosynthesis